MMTILEIGQLKKSILKAGLAENARIHIRTAGTSLSDAEDEQGREFFATIGHAEREIQIARQLWQEIEQL